MNQADISVLLLGAEQRLINHMDILISVNIYCQNHPNKIIKAFHFPSFELSYQNISVQ